MGPIPKLEYKAIAATTINEFNGALAEYVKDGWFQSGDLQVTPHQDATGYGMQYSMLIAKEVKE